MRCLLVALLVVLVSTGLATSSHTPNVVVFEMMYTASAIVFQDPIKQLQFEISSAKIPTALTRSWHSRPVVVVVVRRSRRS